MSTYRHYHDSARQQPENFWREQAEKLDWFRFPQTILAKDGNGIDRWFVDGELNLCHMALDHHIEAGRGGDTALIYDSPVTGQKARYSYLSLRNEVAKVAGMLAGLGVGKGDRVVIYMPMIPEAAMAMLACARLGAVHSVVFGGFAAHELAVRIEDAEPRVLLTASCGIEVNKVIPYKPLVDKAVMDSRWKPEQVVVLQRPQCEAVLAEERDLDWQALLARAEPHPCVPVRATDPLYILYTSGTTGKPKGVVRDSGGYAVALHFSMAAVFDLKPGEVMFTASDVGWVVGHSYIVYGPLLRGCTSILYEGKPVKTPDPDAFWRLCDEYGVSVLFSAPTAFRAIKKEDPAGEGVRRYPMARLRHIYMAGERLDPPTLEWVMTHTGRPVTDNWWQTETGWPIAANPIGLEPHAIKPGSATLPVPGFNVEVLDEAGQPVPANTQGLIALREPLPPGCLTTIWRNHDRYRAGYLNSFPGYYVSGDGGYLDEDGYLFVMGRVDDVINVAGHRLSTGEMEEVLAGHPAVAECAVVGVQDELKGQQPLGLVVLKDGVHTPPGQIVEELIALVRQRIGPLACFKAALVVGRLPKTRSGKILRRIIRQMADGEPWALPSTIEDPASLEDIARVLQSRR
ncbi:propionyl-CoA synthetase [Zobellella iuensis]|uniref:Propionyl-CoA synthetase n=1 Tax=Zobellella iuensis TaxID=2803811 RepID=A0ABS1QVA0_9GAMM|nr:propionyl-CoA synthetase [Zobellella iuensis]MBL1378467.1 propionyl-CoA synthetase [Zobellella iuensis]